MQDAPDTVINDPKVFIVFQDANQHYVANAAIELVGINDPAMIEFNVLVNGTPMMV